MFFADHNPPHFHAEYGDTTAVIEIDGFAVLRSDLPPPALAIDWASQHKDELMAAWQKAKDMQSPGKISPLV